VTPTPLCGSGAVIAEGRLNLSRNLNPPGDETVKLSGEMQLTALSPPIDPSVHGLTFTVLDDGGAVLFTRYVPPGQSPGGGAPGWRVGATRWKFTDATGALADGVNKVKVTQRAPGLFAFKVKGRNGSFQVPPPDESLRLIVTMGGPTEAALGQCAEVAFNPFGGPMPACRFLSVFDRLKCR
jgi:hypothetical protein